MLIYYLNDVPDYVVHSFFVKPADASTYTEITFLLVEITLLLVSIKLLGEEFFPQMS